MFENVVLRKLFWLMNSELSKQFRMQRKEEFSCLHRSPSIVTTVENEEVWRARNVTAIGRHECILLVAEELVE